MNNAKLIVIAAIAIAIGAISGYGYGQKTGYARGTGDGYQRAQGDFKNLQAAAAQKAAQEAAKTANPFQTANPLQNVTTNPFEKTQKILNPFQ